MLLTQRGVAESFTVCTGVGRQGKEIRLPGYERARTTVVLMGVARLAAVIGALLESVGYEDGTLAKNYGATKRRAGSACPPYIPIAVIERASMPDQRVITSTLRDVVSVMENVEEQRPPGMIVIGWAVLGTFGDGFVGSGLLDEAEGKTETERTDEERVKNWLGNMRWRIEEGIDDI